MFSSFRFLRDYAAEIVRFDGTFNGETVQEESVPSPLVGEGCDIRVQRMSRGEGLARMLPPINLSPPNARLTKPEMSVLPILLSRLAGRGDRRVTNAGISPHVFRKNIL
jgi:hypothetical protein